MSQGNITRTTVPHSKYPFSKDSDLLNNLNLQNYSHVEIAESSKVYGLLAAYVLKTCTSPANSLTVDIGQAKDITSKASVLASLKKKEPETAASTLGLGMFMFQHNNRTLQCLHQRIGAPVGTNCGPKIFTSLVIFVEGDGANCKNVVEDLINHLLAHEGSPKRETFIVFRWHMKYQYWMKDVTVLSRSIESVVLKDEVKTTVTNDMDDFLDESTLEFYLDHGIPYKRSYLFYGAPGSGKTSLIQALAGKYQRNVCYLQPSHPDMTDDSLKEAIKRCPRRSIVVFEDIDALFDDKREGNHKSHLTFSGLLNALDGVGPPLAQIFILTTNHRERLDPALIRNGRVDLHVQFTPATTQQMGSIFLAYYPGEKALATEFSTKLQGLLGDEHVSMAAMQHFFISNRKSTVEEAVGNVEQIPENLKEQKDTKDKVEKLNNVKGIGAKKALATEFSTKLQGLLGDEHVSMAAMQHFFISNRKSTVEEAVGSDFKDIGAKVTKKISLKMVIIGLLIASMLFFGGILTGSIVATYIVKGTETSGDGILQVKVKTQEAITWKKTPIVGMSNDELRELKYFALSSENGVASFHVKGYQKMIHNNTVCLLVEGGTITFDDDGVHGSTGEVNPYLGEAVDETGRRRFGPLSYTHGSMES